MNARPASPHIPRWVKLTATLILLAGLLLGGVLSAPGVRPVQALNSFPQIRAPQGPASAGVNGTLASFTALIPEGLSLYLPLVAK